MFTTVKKLVTVHKNYIGHEKKMICIQILILTNFSCLSQGRISEKTKRKVFECQNRWQYIHLDSAIRLNVIYVHKNAFAHAHAVPNLIIGINSVGDTIGVVDKSVSFSVHEIDLL